MKLILFLCMAAVAMSAQAYVGPGLGVGAIGAVLGVMFSILLGVFAIVWYPLKRLFKRIVKKDKPNQSPGA